MIALAYFSIPFALAIFVTKRRDLKFGWVYWAFAVFILACGLTHILSIYTLWVPVYGVEGLVKAVTAAASLFTAGMLWPLLPELLTIPSPFELRQAREALKEEEMKGRDSEQLLQQFRQAQQALRESMARLTAVVETAVDGFILIDARGRIVLFNPACERLFGYRAEEVFHENVKMLMPQKYSLHHDDYIRNFLQTGERKIIGIGREVIGLRKDGSTFPMDLSVGEAKQDGESIFVGIIHDLTARKHTEEQLRQAQKMEMVGQLSGGIAHDFNNLLTVIVGNAEHLSEQLKSRQDLQRIADDICQAGERGAELTQRLLAFSRRQLLHPRAVDCRELARFDAQAAQANAARKHRDRDRPEFRYDSGLCRSRATGIVGPQSRPQRAGRHAQWRTSDIEHRRRLARRSLPGPSSGDRGRRVRHDRGNR